MKIICGREEKNESNLKVALNIDKAENAYI